MRYKCKHHKDGKFVKYIRRTYKNKLCALVLLVTAVLGITALQDGTALVLFIVFGLPLFFAKHNCIG